jgi:hypothetical protein
MQRCCLRAGGGGRTEGPSRMFARLSGGGRTYRVEAMLTEFWKLAFGLLVVVFHREIADFVLRQEETMVGLFRSRGLQMPLFSREAIRNVYFLVGVSIAAMEMLRIWLTL